ncbi:MAG: amino acid permease [Thermomonas sp.]|uniref:amino acid permease n=1 Tax=Thermomonas sp. TaxID=1971895 RepID=UPI0026120831|nr:amino acid permease [Thermomonas sp.]MCC7097897.1 amino acid permease [Thermomonas sp.]
MPREAHKALGLWSATALVVGTIIGSGVFLLPAALAPYGGISLFGWAITLTGALALAATLARLAIRWPQTGGPYAFARNAFGDLPGFLVAWSYWICNWTGCAAISVAFAGSLGAIFPGLVATPLRSAACALAALWFCIGINLAGMREFGRVQIILTVLKFLPLLLFGGIAIWLIDGSHYRPLNPSTEPLPQAINATVALTVWSLLGLETATVPAGSIERPERTIPRATVLGTLLAGIATVLTVSAVIGIVPLAQLQVSTAPMADAARLLWGSRAGLGIALVAAISCLGALNSSVMAAAQVALAAADDRLLPAFFARKDTRGTLAPSILLVGVLATVLVYSNFSRSLVQMFTFVILLSTAATLLPYIASCAAWLRRGQGGKPAALLALAFSLYALIGTGTEALLWGGVLLLAGLPVYAWMRCKA